MLIKLKNIKIIFSTVLILLSSLFLSACNEEPKYIKRDFKNGTSIEVEVDDKITKDNWNCTDDCSGHKAGYDWAEKKGISDPSDCGGNSTSFIEGCEAYANEQ